MNDILLGCVPSVYFLLMVCLFLCVFLFIAVYKKAELAKKTEVQAHSPSRKFILKPAIKYTRPTQLSCVKRKTTGRLTVQFCNVAGKHRHVLFCFCFFFKFHYRSSFFILFFFQKYPSSHERFQLFTCLVSFFFFFFSFPCRRGHDHLFLCHAQT